MGMEEGTETWPQIAGWVGGAFNTIHACNVVPVSDISLIDGMEFPVLSQDKYTVCFFRGLGFLTLPPNRPFLSFSSCPIDCTSVLASLSPLLWLCVS